MSSYILECYLWELFWILKVGPIRENLYLLCQYLKALPARDHFKINSQLEVFWSSQVIWIQASYHYKFSGESIFPLFQVLCFIKDNFLYRPLKGDEIFLVPHNTDSVTLQHCRYYVCILLLNYWQTLNFASFTSTRYDTRKCWSSPPSFQNVLNVKDYFQWSTSSLDVHLRLVSELGVRSHSPQNSSTPNVQGWWELVRWSDFASLWAAIYGCQCPQPVFCVFGGGGGDAHVKIVNVKHYQRVCFKKRKNK